VTQRSAYAGLLVRSNRHANPGPTHQDALLVLASSDIPANLLSKIRVIYRYFRSARPDIEHFHAIRPKIINNGLLQGVTYIIRTYDEFSLHHFSAWFNFF
jgi:hypothetical protein